MVERKTDKKILNSNQPVRVLGIETSCDESAAAVIVDGRIVQSSVVASQVELHARYGGVFPEVASRQHINAIYSVLEQALNEAHVTLSNIDGISVTRGPGLAGSLIVGVNMAKGLAIAQNIPLIGINHLEGHIYSAWTYPGNSIESINPPPEPQFPLLALLVSGGHSELILMTNHLTYQRLGGTLDDAAGEAFDKVARLIGLPYPGGPAIQSASENGNPAAFSFPRAWLEGTWNFSFSGLKTAVLRTVRDIESSHPGNDSKNHLPVADLAASFQSAVVDVLVGKTIRAAEKHKAREILVAGGVSANKMLRDTMLAKSSLKVHIPSLTLCTDNAAMIAAAGYYHLIAAERDPLNFDVVPTWHLE